MRERNLLAVIVAAGLFVGCEKPAETPAPATPTPAPTAGASTPAPSETPAPAALPEAATPPAVTETPAAADPAQADATAKAKTLLDEVMTYVKENKLDLAEKSLTQLESMKGSLPASFVPQIEKARTMFDTAKKGNDLKNIGGNLLGK